MRRTPATIVAAAAACCALAAPAQAASEARVTELGDFAAPFQLPAADCPTDCQAIAQLTGFQVQVGTHSTPFRLRSNGYVVAFALRLAQPSSPDQVGFFNGLFGSPARVRLAIIRAVSQKKKTYKLLKQSQSFRMDPYFKSTQSFALHTPFRVHTDDIVALTVPTWLPAFRHNLPSDNAWRSSHLAKDCAVDRPPPAAHETVGSTQAYNCFYRGARLLYTATFVPDAKVTNTSAAR